jgi:hypothetical protein
MFKSFVE